MLPFLLALQLVAADSTYSTPALRDLVAGVVVANRQPPSELRSYRTRVETEVAVVVRDENATEFASQIEQIESGVHWVRPGAFEQVVIGHRIQAAGPGFSALNMFRQSWMVPVLYGNRMSLLFPDDTTAQARKRRAKEKKPVLTVHPFAEDGAPYYRYSGGDTIAVLHLRGRTVHVVRIHVEPKSGLQGRTELFAGDIDVDAERLAIVRMRGRIVRDGPRGALEHLASAAVEAVAFLELENAEVDGRYWLPSRQRLEVQVRGTLSANGRSAVRAVSRFGSYEINGGTAGDVVSEQSNGTFATAGHATEAEQPAAAMADADSLIPLPRRFSLSSRDSIDHFEEWRQDLGAVTAELQAGDFDDVGPDAWRRSGQARVDFTPRHFGDVFRFNRVEGAYTGLAAGVRFRDALPGLALHGWGGWAWEEQTVKGGVAGEYARAPWLYSATAERGLAYTNDFLPPFHQSATFDALLSSRDDYDYVDRRSASLGVARAVDAKGFVVLRVEGGSGSDRAEASRVERGVFKGDSGFRPNRGVAEGRYLRSAAELTVNPNVSGDFLQTGVGATLSYERGDGGLEWQRWEGRVTTRQHWRALTFSSRLHAGAVFGGEIPPQQLFELGKEGALPGYDYKEFAGDRAALARGAMTYNIPVWRAPIRLFRWYLPGLSPALSTGLQAGWADASTTSARRAIARLGPLTAGDGSVIVDPVTLEPMPVSRPTGGVRATLDVRLTFFGGMLGIGIARAIDHRDRWDLFPAVGQ
jgi:hypothetical protein